MAIAKLSPMYAGYRGAIGTLVVRQYPGRTVVSRKPVFRNRVFSPAQKARQEKFRQAARYATRLMDDPRARRVYEEEARVKRKPILSLMISDFLRAPSVTDVGIVPSSSHHIAREEKPQSHMGSETFIRLKSVCIRSVFSVIRGESSCREEEPLVTRRHGISVMKC